MPTFYEWQGNDLILRIKAQPKASKDEFAEILDDRVKVRITAPPIEGKANKHLIKFLARQFRVSQSQIELLTGDNAREKRFIIRSPKQLPAIISGATD